MKGSMILKTLFRYLFLCSTGVALSLLSFEGSALSQSSQDFNSQFLAGVRSAGGSDAVGGSPKQACSRLLGFIEGGFGALVATAAGIGVIIAAASGGFRAAWCLLVVSVGCFILRSYLTLFLPPCR